jgi:hypothetical protein
MSTFEITGDLMAVAKDAATAAFLRGEDATRAVVEAVAPAIRAQALRDQADYLHGDETAYAGTLKRIHHEIYAAWLRERADEIERGAS